MVSFASCTATAAAGEHNPHSCALPATRCPPARRLDWAALLRWPARERGAGAAGPCDEPGLHSTGHITQESQGEGGRLGTRAGVLCASMGLLGLFVCVCVWGGGMGGWGLWCMCVLAPLFGRMPIRSEGMCGMVAWRERGNPLAHPWCGRSVNGLSSCTLTRTPPPTPADWRRERYHRRSRPAAAARRCCCCCSRGAAAQHGIQFWHPPGRWGIWHRIHCHHHRHCRPPAANGERGAQRAGGGAAAGPRAGQHRQDHR